MAEPSNYSDQELGQIRSILEPLSKNPETSEDLNPMLSTFREKMGYGVPINIEDEDSDSGEAPEEDTFDLGGEEEEAPEPTQRPKPLSFSEEDDIDLDELLTEPSAAGSTPSIDAGDDPFGGFDETPPASDDFGDFGSPEPAQTEEDPFASSGMDDFGVPETADSSPDTTGFGGGDDPFGGLDSAPTLDSPLEDFDANPPAASDDFGASSDFNMDDLGSPADSDSDPFAGFGGDDSPAASEDLGDFGAEPPTEEDPFANFDASEMEDSPGDEFGLGEGDPFGAAPAGESDFGDLGGFDDSSADSGASFDEAPTGDSDPFADFAPVAGGDHDPFSDLSSATSVPESDPFADFSAEPAGEMELESVPESADFTSFSPDLDADSDSDLGAAAFEEDLRSLGGEEKEDIDKSLTDEELAIIQKEILRYPPLLRKTVIESIVQDRLSKKAQRDLLELIKVESTPDEVAAFLSSALGVPVTLTDRTGAYSADGVPIITSDPIYTREGYIERRKKIRRTFYAVAAALLLGFGGYFTYKHIILPRQAAQNYEAGLEQIREMGAKKFAGSLGEEDRKKYLTSIEDSYDKGFDIDPYNLKYMNLYGVEYSRAGEYELSFEKLFGRIEPDLGAGTLDSWNKREQAPLVRLAQGESWNDKKFKTSTVVNQGKEGVKFLLDQEKTARKVVVPGAFLVMRLRDKSHDNNTYRNLGWFHSQIMPDFAEPSEGKKGRYKNDALSVDYYSKVFTDGESPYDELSTAGIAKIYYNRREFGKAASFYNRIVEANPKSVPGQSGLISTYLEMWKESGDPQFVLNHHRLLRNNLDMESELPFYTLSKLASFYATIDPQELRIKYNINPVDQVSGIEIEESAIRLLDTIYRRSMEDERTGTEIEGKDYAEGYYQRGQYYLSQKENIQARRFFEKAATLDPKHWLAVLELAEHSIRVGNFEEAKDLLKEADARYQASMRWFGSKDEDETLYEGNPARIHFDLGKIRYLLSAGLSEKESLKEFPGRKIYPFRSRSESDGKSLSVLKEEEEKRNRRNELRNSLQEFNLVDAEEPQFDLIRKWRRELPASLLREMKFYKGWVEYMDSDFDKALADWTGFEDKDEYYNATLLMGKGNAFFYTGQTKTALGYFLRVKDDMEEKLPQMSSPKTEDPYHQEVYQTLIAAYNNIGACYENLSKKAGVQESENYTAQALQNYWKAIETARKINEASEISLSNKDLLFKKDALKREPLLEDWVSPTLESIKDLVRK
ncbi:hypothetical protein EHQ53_18115 [Leptospira langatensis]|uniref:Tetratricopeptide repeat protein n=1 Tax=Leptospira langatensis TaxID=2484983 RepID=A0A5F1ZRK8_9LEPT|nr:tetratricopeptide repeat protein [Leptospira langatensis]TGK05536.1 hypothetical protein EHO57_02355 [Leptospira langatensis]TGL38670.1 hypothetical protein EHQ53_18115 [Leptospira langatensis]